jgi:hypothetical protein
MSYQDVLVWAEERGFSLHEAAERRCVNGLWGMFATEDIPKGTAFASFPTDGLLKPRAEDYPKGTSLSVQHIHSAALARHCDDDGRYFTQLCEPLAELKDFSAYFLEDKEIQTIAEVSPILAREIMMFRHKCRVIIQSLLQFDPKISEDIYTETVLNFHSRAVGDWGFVPIIDCFNHSEPSGLPFVPSETSVSVVAKRDIEAGEELFVSYGRLDLFRHAVQYNYYDPHDMHFIEFGRRVRFSISKSTKLEDSEFEKGGFQLAKQDTPLSQVFSVSHRDALLSTDGPSDKLIELMNFLVKSVFRSEPAKDILVAKLQELNDSNRIHTVPKKYLTGRLKRFYAPLNRDKHIIERSLSVLDRKK